MADWRKIPQQTRWRTFKKAGKYAIRRQQALWIDFDSGKEEWRDAKESFSGDYVERIETPFDPFYDPISEGV